jgi:hypothetical protein
MTERIIFFAIGAALSATYFYSVGQTQTRNLEACYVKEFQFYGADGWKDAGEVPWVIDFCKQRVKNS